MHVFKTGKLAALLFFSCVVFTSPIFARQADNPEIRARREVLAEVIERIDTELFEPTLAPGYVEALERLSTSADIMEPDDDDQFALRVHHLLQAVKADGHLSIYGPVRTQGLFVQFYADDEEGAAVDEPLDQVPPFLIERRDVDGGQAAIITLNGFSDSDDVATALNSAIGALPTGTALVFDLRGNRGGNARHFRILAGCLFSEPTAVHAIRWREGDGFRTVIRHSETDPVCAHHSISPVYVLVDRGTASTAELMPFILQARDRATIIGETTYGAGHAAEFYELPNGYSMMIPIGATYDPVTNLEWDGHGVSPDIAVAPENALDTALADFAGRMMCARIAGLAPGYACAVSLAEIE